MRQEFYQEGLAPGDEAVHAHVLSPGRVPPGPPYDILRAVHRDVFLYHRRLVLRHLRRPGGDKALMDYIQQNLRNPDNRQGRVVVTFWVEPDGSLTGAGVVKSVAPELDREALRLVSTMPKWMPGKRNGEGVRVKYTLPVTFKPT